MTYHLHLPSGVITIPATDEIEKVTYDGKPMKLFPCEECPLIDSNV